MNVKNLLLQLELVVDNSYLDEYVSIVESNKGTVWCKDKTHTHHIVPRSYYIKKHIRIDESESNKVVLSYKDHILAHYYLAMCSKEDWFKVKNMWAVSYMVGNYEKISRTQFIYLDLDAICMCRESSINSMQIEDIRKKHDDIMRKQETRDKISKTLKLRSPKGDLFKEEHRKKISESSKGRIRIHKDGVYTHVKKEVLQEYLDKGWVIGGRPISEEHKQALINSHLGKKYSPELRKKLSDAHLGQPAWNKGVSCRQETRDKLRESISGRIRITNGIVTKCIKPEQFSEFEKLGYYKSAKKYSK